MEHSSTNMETIKEGDYVSYDDSLFGKQFGYYVTGDIVEIIGDWGWSRNDSIPESYTPKGSYKYWHVSNIKKCLKPNISYDMGIMYYTGLEETIPSLSHKDIIKSNYIKYKDMNLIDKIRVNIKVEPMKTLIKNDILTLDERLTGTGKELFTDFLYDKFKDEFAADLAPKLEGLTLEK